MESFGTEISGNRRHRSGLSPESLAAFIPGLVDAISWFQGINPNPDLSNASCCVARMFLVSVVDCLEGFSRLISHTVLLIMLFFLGFLSGPIWTSLWSSVYGICKRIFLPFRGLPNMISSGIWRPTNCTSVNEESRLPVDRALPSTSHTIITKKHRAVIKQSSNQKLLLIGIFAEVYLMDGKTIRKAPRSESDEDTQPIIREATIYNILGDHPCIAQCMSGERTDYIDIKYYAHGDLASFCREGRLTTELREKWFLQLIEAIEIIHRYGIIHSDLALRQYFVDDELNIRLGDFNSSQYPDHPALGYEKATHCLPRDYELPNSTQSDLFALGSTLYELVTGNNPYSNLYPVEPKDIIQSSDPDVITARLQRGQQADAEVERRYRNRVFPDVSDVFRGDVILGCWNGDISSAEQAIHIYAHGPS